MLFPLKDSDLVVWLDHFVLTLERHATLFDITPAEVHSVTNDAAMLRYLVQIEVPAFESALSERKKYQNVLKYGSNGDVVKLMSETPVLERPPAAVEPGILPRLQLLVSRIKSSQNYTDALCNEFRFFDCETERNVDLTSIKPTGRAIGQPFSEVRVEFVKKAFDGVLIESRRTGQDEWRRLATDNFSPYVDSRPLVRGGRPEVREYRMRFLLSDEPVGEWSDILVATASE